MKHKVKLVENLLYYGCEKHWQCEYCGEAYPTHCYTKEQVERFTCRKDYKIGDKVIYNPDCVLSEDGIPRYIICKGTILEECKLSSSKGTPMYKIKIDEVICDDSGNDYFLYLQKTGKDYPASVKYLKRVDK